MTPPTRGGCCCGAPPEIHAVDAASTPTRRPWRTSTQPGLDAYRRRRMSTLLPVDACRTDAPPAVDGHRRRRVSTPMPKRQSKWSRKGHFWETFWSPFACNFAIVAPCQNLSICYVLTTLCGSGPGPFSLLNASWERSTPAEPSFRDFLRPWGRHGDRQGAAGHPKDVRKATRGHPETTKNQASGAPGVSGLSRAVPGVPPRTKNDPKTSKNRLLRRPAFVENSR